MDLYQIDENPSGNEEELRTAMRIAVIGVGKTGAMALLGDVIDSRKEQKLTKQFHTLAGIATSRSVLLL